MDEYKTVKETCPYCGGTGYGAPVITIMPFITFIPCIECSGSGYVEKKVKVSK